MKHPTPFQRVTWARQSIPPSSMASITTVIALGPERGCPPHFFREAGCALGPKAHTGMWTPEPPMAVTITQGV